MTAARPQLGWIPSGAIGGALLALTDVVLAPTGEAALSIMVAAGLGTLVGGLLGTVLHGAERAARRLPRWLILAALPLLAAVLGLVVAVQLGAFSRLDGAYRALALGLLVAGPLGGACIGFMAALMLSPPAVVTERLAVPRGRALFGGAFAVVALALVYADRSYFVARYPLGHDALGVGSLWFLICSLRAAAPALSSVRARRGMGAGAIALALLAALILDAGGQDALRTRYLARGTRSWMLRGVRFATDFDRDGYSGWFGGGDCAPFTAAVSPRAVEVPGNGLDDNCILGDARKVEPRGAQEVARPSTPSPVNVVLITVDTWRFDRNSFDRPDLDTTPNLRAWAEHAVRFDRAYTAGGVTAISISSLMRGIYPRRLRWTQLVDTTDYQMLRLSEATDIPLHQIRMRFGLPLDDASWALPRWLRWRGMRTAAVTDDGWVSEMLAPRYLSDGFDTFVDVDTVSAASPNDDASTVTAALSTLDQLRAGDAPFLLWVHMFGLHAPTRDRPDIPRRTPGPLGEYDQALTYFDRELQRLFRALEPIGDRTIVVITADHGERFAGNDRFHGTDMLETSIRVPMFIKVPGGRAGVEHTPVSTVDILPTLLALTRTPVPDQLDGLDLSALVTSGRAIPPRILLSDTWLIHRRGELMTDLVAAFDGERKLVIDRLTQAKTLVDQRDPSDTPENLIDREPSGALRDALLRYLDETNGPNFVER